MKMVRVGSLDRQRPGGSHEAIVTKTCDHLYNVWCKMMFDKILNPPNLIGFDVSKRLREKW